MYKTQDRKKINILVKMDKLFLAKRIFLLLMLLIVIFIYFVYKAEMNLSEKTALQYQAQNISQTFSQQTLHIANNTIHIAIIMIGKTYHTFGLVLIKSLIFTTKRNINLYIVTSDNAVDKLNGYMKRWPEHITQRVNVFRVDINENDWDKHLPLLDGKLQIKLRTYGSLLDSELVSSMTTKMIYIDTDYVMLDDVANLWDIFEQFKPGETIYTTSGARYLGGGYKKSNETFIYNNRGINAGLMLMDMGKLKAKSFFEKLVECSKHSHSILKVTDDQDLLVLYFQNYPEQHGLLPCSWNMRNSMCKCNEEVNPELRCTDAEENGIHSVHGTHLRLLWDGQFQVLYFCMGNMDFNNTSKTVQCLMGGIKEYRKKEKHCLNKQKFLNHLEETILMHYSIESNR